MTLVWIFVVGLALWFGFNLGRKWDLGEMELEAEEYQASRERGGIRLTTVTIRR